MKPVVNGYVLKEYGSWSVLLVAYAIGLGVSGVFPWDAIPVLLALCLFVNSKRAFTKWVRQPGTEKHLLIFSTQVAVGGAILLMIFHAGIPQLLPLLVLPAAYLVLHRLAGEHFLFTELLGFALLSLAAVLAKFLVVGGVDIRLFVATALYFTAGVFKVKAVLLKEIRYRVLTVLYVLFAVYAYRRFYIDLVILLPLAENVVMAVTPYNVRLQTTGWVEIVKSLAFLSLMITLF
jgi:hypothetical protein